MSTRQPALDLSVIIPMDDDHGFGEACVDSWNGQSHPRERLQLVVIDAGNNRELIERVRPRLAPHDIFLTVPTDNEGLLYDQGARAAQADLLFTTEGHCVAEPRAAREILDVFANPDVAAVNARSTHIEPTIIAKQQSLLEKEWVAFWPAGDWRTISLRGLGVRRRIYHELGGFRPEHRRFCANAFIIELERHGLHLAPTPSEIIRHCNSPTIRDVAVTLYDCGRGQIVWRSDLERQNLPDVADQYIGGLNLWSRRGDLDRKTARILVGALLRSIKLKGSEERQKTKHALPTLLRLLSGIIFGPWATAWAQRFALGWAMVACYFARLHGKNLLPRYHRLWCKSFDSGFADFAARYPVQPQWFVPSPDPVPFAALAEGATAGFYARENWGAHGPVIRWSSAAFLLRLKLFATTRIILDVRSNVPAGKRSLTAFLNGFRIASSALQERGDDLMIKLPAEFCRPDGHNELVITCLTTRPRDRGEADCRCLGLAVFNIKTEEPNAISNHESGHSSDYSTARGFAAVECGDTSTVSVK